MSGAANPHASFLVPIMRSAPPLVNVKDSLQLLDGLACRRLLAFGRNVRLPVTHASVL